MCIILLEIKVKRRHWHTVGRGPRARTNPLFSMTVISSHLASCSHRPLHVLKSLALLFLYGSEPRPGNGWQDLVDDVNSRELSPCVIDVLVEKHPNLGFSRGYKIGLL